MKSAVLFLILLAVSGRMFGLETVRLDPSVSTVNISDQVDVLEDMTGKLTYDDVAGLSGYFNPHKNQSFNFGYTQSAFWIRSVVANETAEHPGAWVLETEYPWIFSIDLYLTGPDGKTGHIQQVKKQPFYTRAIRNRNFTLPLRLEKGNSVLLIRITGNPLHFRLKVTQEKTFYESASLDYLLLGNYYGVIVLIILLSGALYLRIREPVYIFNILYMSTMGILQFTLNGLAYQYFWPDLTNWHEISTNFLPGVSLFFGVILARRFLDTKKNTPFMNVILYVFQAISVADMVCALLNLQIPCLVLINILMIGVPILFIIMGLVCLKKGFYPARYFLLTFVLQAFLLVIYAFKDQGLLPNTILTEYGIQIAVLGQILFLSLAMFDRFNLSVKEKEKLQQDMQTSLERQVKERTLELVKKQDEIDKDMAQASLVQQSTLTKTDWAGHFGYMDVDVQYLPMNGKTSGDYYNIQKTDSAFGQCLAVLIADATGHGIQAALSTMQIDIINRESLWIQFPHERLAFINRALMERVTTKNFFTGFEAFIYGDKIVFAGAGHPFQIIVKTARKEIVRMKPEGKPLGIFGNLDYKMQIENLEPGDVLLFYTDGLIEEFNRNEEEFGEENLVLFLKEVFFGEGSRLLNAPAAEITRTLLQNIESYCKGIKFNDDITVICVRITDEKRP